ncbi:defensin-like [Thrips palmi]|uniref:Defensin-like n=1 Tax=Thrips palmi TaxID=161013 RepID=A0A6P8ZQT7_THRPL|nr:defensin-like [Thrips palmi]
MKSFAVLAVFAVAVVVASLTPSVQASPVAPMQDNADPVADDEAQLVPEPYAEGRADRHARATCDLLSFSSKWVTPNHSACAAHCIAMFKGFKGGRCQNAVCVCRK